MKLGLKELIIIALLAVFGLPLMYIAAMFATGNLTIALRKQGLPEFAQEALRTIPNSILRDSISQVHMKTYQSILREKEDVARRKEQLAATEERLTILQGELERAREQLAQDREKLEKLISQNELLQDKKLRQLAKVYGAMRPAEAARILETLDDNLVIKIISGISDDRQRGKLLGALSNEKASRISKKMGAPR